MKLSEVLYNRVESLREERKRVKRGEPPTGFVTTGLRSLDRWGGNKRKQVTIYGLDTGMGKSMLKWQFVRAGALEGFTATVLDMEDPPERSADRLFSTETNINSAKMVNGQLSDEEITRITLAAAEMEEWADRVEYFEGVKTGEEALELLEEFVADQQHVDYLSAFPHGKHGRERTISDFMWGWTKICQEHDIAGVAYAQLKGEVTERGHRIHEMAKRRNPSAPPDISGFRGWDHNDLAWCSDAGRNAKGLWFGTRPAELLRRLGVKAEDNVMELDSPKQNWGPSGRVRLGIDLKHARFYDLEKDTK